MHVPFPTRAKCLCNPDVVRVYECVKCVHVTSIKLEITLGQGRLVMKAKKAAAYPVCQHNIFFFNFFLF